jgi:sulfopyruvate decarboxylase subunit beta
MHFSKIIYDMLREEKIGLICTLPCNKFADLIRNMPAEFIHIPLNREENGVGISAGFYLTGGRPLMMIQSSGLGNSLNALMSLHKGYAFPLPILASWRGRENDKFPCHIPFGKSLPDLFKLLEVPFTVIEQPDQIRNISRAIQNSFNHPMPHIVLLPPELWEADEDKAPKPILGARGKFSELSYTTRFVSPELTRHEAIKTLSDLFGDAIAITTIGTTCDELHHVKDRDLNFYLYAAMGQASSVGLGMAINTKRRVFVLDGDGSLLMNPNILCEIAVMKPPNLTVVALDNGTFTTTGEQKIPSYDLVDLELMARSLGITQTRKAFTRNEIVEGLQNLEGGPGFLHVIVKPGVTPGGKVLHPHDVKTRFMRAVLDPGQHASSG